MTRPTNLRRLLDEYLVALENSDLTDKSVDDYYQFASMFVRWAEGDFEPGLNAYGARSAPVSRNGHGQR